MPQDRVYQKTCDQYPVHASVVRARLDEAATDWAEGNKRQARETVAEALDWIEEMPVIHDRIALLRSRLEDLPDDHPIRPTLEQRIERWIEGLPEVNRGYWRECMGPIPRVGSPPTTD